jgi:hypothetical protein
MVVGEYAGGQVLLATESSIHTSRISAVKASGRVVCAPLFDLSNKKYPLWVKTLQKTEDTWYRVLGYYRYRIRFNPEIAESFEGWWYGWHFVHF